MELVLMCICLLMLLEHAKFVPQRSILCQHSVILCGSSDGGTKHAVGLQKFAVPEPREQVVKVHLHSVITVSLTHSTHTAQHSRHISAAVGQGENATETGGDACAH